MTNPQTIRIRQLNDLFRTTFLTGRLVITQGVAALDEAGQQAILERVRAHDTFDEGNDPWGEHDFGAFEWDGTTYFWKIDYYDASFTRGSEDPADPQITRRVLTIMRADEY